MTFYATFIEGSNVKHITEREALIQARQIAATQIGHKVYVMQAIIKVERKAPPIEAIALAPWCDADGLLSGSEE